MVITIIILILSVLGFTNAYYLYWQHKKELITGQKMFCLIGGDCGEVVGSKYGRTFGVKNEITGMAYYISLATYTLLTLLLPNLAANLAVFAKTGVYLAVAFSIYLLFIQSVILRKFCSWCLIAIGINILLAYLTFI